MQPIQCITILFKLVDIVLSRYTKFDSTFFTSIEMFNQTNFFQFMELGIKN